MPAAHLHAGVKKILLIDNYDSFTYNLQHLLLMVPDVQLEVKRNDANLLAVMQAGQFDGVVIGPGPGSPEDPHYFGDNQQIILRYGTAGVPILGVCLGLQGIYYAFGGRLKMSTHPMHGKTSRLCIVAPGSRILRGIAPEATVMRYHSIVADLRVVPECLRLTAYAESAQHGSDTQELMALEHRQYPIYGVQFHPESFATECGIAIIENFLAVCGSLARPTPLKVPM